MEILPRLDTGRIVGFGAVSFSNPICCNAARGRSYSATVLLSLPLWTDLSGMRAFVAQWPWNKQFKILALKQFLLFLAETVSGGSLAAYAPPTEYFTIIRQICDHYHVLLILDEVMCGLGRTGRWFACQHYGVIPDIITLGKGLGGGVVPISAVGVRSEHFDSICNGTGEFIHGGTFSHHPVAAAAALATIRIIEKEGLVERVSQMGYVLGEKLKDALQDHPNVADVRGLGYLWGVEIVEKKVNNKPFPRCEKVAERLLEAIFKKGVLVYKSTALAGIDGDAFLVAPPFIIKEDEIDFVVDKIRNGIESVLGS